MSSRRFACGKGCFAAAAVGLLLAGCSSGGAGASSEKKWTTLWRIRVGAPPQEVPFRLNQASLPARITLENPNQVVLLTVSPERGGSFVTRLGAGGGDDKIILKTDGEYTLSGMDTDRSFVVLVQSQNPNKSLK